MICVTFGYHGVRFLRRAKNRTTAARSLVQFPDQYSFLTQITHVSGARESLKLLGALTDEGETFFVECESNFTSEVTIQFLQALQQEFGEKIAVVLDHATYFTANAVKDFAADTAIELIYFPRRSPQLNPSEECWRQFKQFLGNHSFDDFAELRDTMRPALDAVSPPNIRNYLLP